MLTQKWWITRDHMIKNEDRKEKMLPLLEELSAHVSKTHFVNSWVKVGFELLISFAFLNSYLSHKLSQSFLQC